MNMPIYREMPEKKCPIGNSSSETVHDYLSKAFPRLTKDLEKGLKRAKRKTTLPSIKLKADKKVEKDEDESDEDEEDKDESDEDEEEKELAEGNVNQIAKDEDEKELAVEPEGSVNQMDHHYLTSIHIATADMELLEKEKKEKDKEINELQILLLSLYGFRLCTVPSSATMTLYSSGGDVQFPSESFMCLLSETNDEEIPEHAL